LTSFLASFVVHAARQPGHPLRSSGADPPGVRRYFGGLAKVIARDLAVHHDHGSQ
jgi:hypothetical protein